MTRAERLAEFMGNSGERREGDNLLYETARMLNSIANAERNPDTKYALELGAHNLERAAQWLQQAIGHGNCYCDECLSLSRAFWTPVITNPTDAKPNSGERREGEK
jgi:hypothetical protein